MSQLPNWARKIELLKQQDEIARELSSIKSQEEYLATLPLNYQVVEMMHSLHCHADHTSGCGYLYESWEKPGDTRKRLIKQADALIERVRGHLCSMDLTPTDSRIFKTIEVCQERFW
jgi:hypothetical protein